MRIGRAEYRSHDFGGIELDADLENQHLSGRLSDRDEALRLLLSVSGTLTEREQRIGVSGNVFDFDLADMGITPEQIGVFKALKIAIELDKFFRRLEAEGRKQYTIGEIADEVFLPVWKL